MERLISDEERIRRAEDVLERRRNTEIKVSNDNFVKEKTSNKLRKMCIQIIVCMCIYCGLYYLKNTKNDNLRNIFGNVKNVLSYDVNFSEIYNNLRGEFEKINAKVVNNNVETNEALENESENKQDNNESNLDNNGGDNNQTQSDQSNNTDEASFDNSDKENQNEENISQNGNLGIGGETDAEVAVDNSNLGYEDQMNNDIEYIKRNYNMENPLKIGIITSSFGTRAGNNIVSNNHKGVDLGAITGSIITSALDGEVIEASSQGDFGIHLKIKKDDIEIIYGHCSELLVKQGDVVSKGQQIAKVGSTGKATGPHLHFEIRRDSRAVDPQKILEF